MSSEKRVHLSRSALGVLFTGAGVAHFTDREFFGQLVPGYLSRYRSEVNWGSGVIQVAGGVSFFFPRLRAVARWANLGLLIPTFPEGINQVRHPERMKALGIPPVMAALRLPAQTLVMAWVWLATRRHQ